jgi:hypothetical protein
MSGTPDELKHLTMCGYFYRDTAVYAYIAKYGGENPAAPGTHSIILDGYGLPAEPMPSGFTPRMIVGLDLLLHPQVPTWWDRIDAVYVAVEGDPVGLKEMADLARYLMSYRRLPHKPVLSYSGVNLFPSSLQPTDILGVQLYAEQGADPVESIKAQAAAYWPQIQAVPKVAIIGQAYDRGGWFTGADLLAIQPVLYDIAISWPNCVGLFWFSDSRTGGTRDYEEIRPWHYSIFGAIQANTGQG